MAPDFPAPAVFSEPGSTLAVETPEPAASFASECFQVLLASHCANAGYFGGHREHAATFQGAQNADVPCWGVLLDYTAMLTFLCIWLSTTFGEDS